MSHPPALQENIFEAGFKLTRGIKCAGGAEGYQWHTCANISLIDWERIKGEFILSATDKCPYEGSDHNKHKCITKKLFPLACAIYQLAKANVPGFTIIETDGVIKSVRVQQWLVDFSAWTAEDELFKNLIALMKDTGLRQKFGADEDKHSRMANATLVLLGLVCSECCQASPSSDCSALFKEAKGNKKNKYALEAKLNELKAADPNNKCLPVLAPPAPNHHTAPLSCPRTPRHLTVPDWQPCLRDNTRLFECFQTTLLEHAKTLDEHETKLAELVEACSILGNTCNALATEQNLSEQSQQDVLPPPPRFRCPSLAPPKWPPLLSGSRRSSQMRREIETELAATVTKLEVFEMELKNLKTKGLKYLKDQASPQQLGPHLATRIACGLHAPAAHAAARSDGVPTRAQAAELKEKTKAVCASAIEESEARLRAAIAESEKRTMAETARVAEKARCEREQLKQRVREQAREMVEQEKQRSEAAAAARTAEFEARELILIYMLRAAAGQPHAYYSLGLRITGEARDRDGGGQLGAGGDQLGAEGGG
tara:strand:- start:383 stop:2005 length:1623 start_codon:yes stop_codon:yes gene_type:complete